MGWIAQNHVGLDSSKHIVWFAHFFFAEKPSGLDSLQTKQENIFLFMYTHLFGNYVLQLASFCGVAKWHGIDLISCCPSLWPKKIACVAESHELLPEPARWQTG